MERRKQKKANPLRSVDVGPFQVDFKAKIVKTPDGKDVHFSAAELDMLVAIGSGEVVSPFNADRIYRALRQDGELYPLPPREIAKKVRRLQKKVEREPQTPQFIKSVRGHGYRLENNGHKKEEQG